MEQVNNTEPPDVEALLATVRQALERDGWRIRGGRRDFSIRDDALIALDAIAGLLHNPDAPYCSERKFLPIGQEGC